MPTKVIELDEEAVGVLRDLLRSTFLDGECYAFAIALKRGLAWPLVGLIDSQGQIRHAMVCGSDQKLYDVRGGFDENDPEIGVPFGMAPPYTAKHLKEADLHRVRPIHSRLISHARRMAEIVWPDLPWKGGQRARVVAFLNELEALCQKHELYIRAPLAAKTSWPVIGNRHGDEAGFVARPTDDGMAYIFDRQLRQSEH